MAVGHFHTTKTYVCYFDLLLWFVTFDLKFALFSAAKTTFHSSIPFFLFFFHSSVNKKHLKNFTTCYCWICVVFKLFYLVVILSAVSVRMWWSCQSLFYLARLSHSRRTLWLTPKKFKCYSFTLLLFRHRQRSRMGNGSPQKKLWLLLIRKSFDTNLLCHNDIGQ